MKLTRKLPSTLLLLGTFMLVFNSCKKDEAQQKKFYMICKINGVKTEFSASTSAISIWDSGDKATSISGIMDSTMSTYAIGFTIENFPSQDSITVGNYTDTSTRFDVLCVYYKLDYSLRYEAGTSEYQDQVYYNAPTGNHFVGTITSITSEGIRGTFSGDFYENGDVQQGSVINITDGEFYVKRYN